MTNKTFFDYGVSSRTEAIELRDKLTATLDLIDETFFGVTPESSSYDYRITKIMIDDLNRLIEDSSYTTTTIPLIRTKAQRIKKKIKLLKKRATLTPYLTKVTAHGIKPIYLESKDNVIFKKTGNRRVRRYDVAIKGNGYRKLFNKKNKNKVA